MNARLKQKRPETEYIDGEGKKEMKIEKDATLDFHIQKYW